MVLVASYDWCLFGCFGLRCLIVVGYVCFLVVFGYLFGGGLMYGLLVTGCVWGI